MAAGKKKAKKSKALAKRKPDTDLKVSDAEAIAAFAGAGMETVTANDLIIPRIQILQDLSPQVKKSKEQYIEGAKVGDICDVAMGEILDEPLHFLPVSYSKVWLEWKPKRGGLARIHDTDAIMAQTKPNDKGKPTLQSGNIVEECAQFFGYRLTDDGPVMCFIPMKSSQLKVARKWMTLATSEKVDREDGSKFTPPLFYRTYILGTVDNSNDQGDWSGWTVERGPTLMEFSDSWKDIFQSAVDLNGQVKSGKAKGDLRDDEAGSGGSGDETPF